MSFVVNFSLSVTASTVESTAVTQTLGASTGTLKKIYVHFPAGCGGKVHVKVIVNGYQILPANAEADVVGDDERIPFDLNIDILNWPADIILKAWNTDDKAHVIDAQVNIVPFQRIGV